MHSHGSNHAMRLKLVEIIDFFEKTKKTDGMPEQ